MDISVETLHQKLQQGDSFIFLDVRQPWEYEEFNLGAQLIPVNDLISQPEVLEEHKQEEIVIHCLSGGRSKMAAQFLEMQGFTRVINVAGGIQAWIQAYGKIVPSR
jgi:rhodanese-related sulfurtransferase